MRDIKDGDDITNADWNALARDLTQESYVEEGCRILNPGAGDLDINIISGTVRFSGTQNTISGGNRTLSANTSYEYRYDLVRTDGAGNVVVVEGSSNNIVPELHSGVGLGFVRVQSGASTIVSDDIFDSRTVDSCGIHGHIENINAHIDNLSDIPTRSHDDLSGVSADDHHTGFVALKADGGSTATPDPDNAIKLAGTGKVDTTAGTNQIYMSIYDDLNEYDNTNSQFLSGYVLTKSLDNDFSSGSVRIERIDQTVTITNYGGLDVSSSDYEHMTSSAFIPSTFQPVANVYNVFYVGATRVQMIKISTTGRLSIILRDWSGSFTSSDTIDGGFSISYTIS